MGSEIIDVSPMCVLCARFDWGNTPNMTCESYVTRIPKEILDGTHDHREPYKGDNGIRFLAIRGAG